MAKVTRVILTDDITGEPATTTVRFGYSGVEYEVDLSDESASIFAETMTEYINVARRVGGRRLRSVGGKAEVQAASEPKATKTAKTPKAPKVPKEPKAAGAVDAAQVRAWAREQGREVPARGRVPAELVEAFLAQAS